MTIQKTVRAYPDAFDIDVPPIFVVSFLADARGRAITKETMANAFYVKTELFNREDEAWARWTALNDEDRAAFTSCQDMHGESIV